MRRLDASNIIIMNKNRWMSKLLHVKDRNLYQRIMEHTSSRSSIGKHMKQHGVDKPTIADNFSVLKTAGIN